jgi:AAA domain
LRRACTENLEQIENRGKALREILVSSVEGLDDILPSDSNVWEAADVIMRGKADFGRPADIIASLSSARGAIRGLLQPVVLDQANTQKVVLEHAILLKHLIPFKSTSPEDNRSRFLEHSSLLKRAQDKQAWSNHREIVRDALLVVNSCFSSLLSRSEFSQEKVTEEQHAVRKAEENLRAAETRISEELVREGRVLLCTIGSSHKLPLAREDDDDESNLSAAFGRLTLATADRSTIVVFDEAGCIPDYEFLGLSRLGRDIKALVCVGDKYQLPPFSAAASKRTSTPRGGGFHGRRQSSFSEPKVTSLLDVSAVEKVKLTTQYRVPHDIANLLNDRIYRGDYKTAPTCTAPLKGFKFIDVTGEANRSGGKQYVNDREIQECIRILGELRRDGRNSIMVLTPVSTLHPRCRLVKETSN